MKIIFLHGFPDNPEVWSQTLNYFEGKATCVAPKIHSFPFDEQVQAVHELTTPHEPVVIVAHDMGGPVAVEYASRHPERVMRVVLVNTMGVAMFAHRLRDLEQLLRSSYMSIFVNPFVRTLTLKPIAKPLLNKLYDLGGLPKGDKLRENSAEVFDGLGRYKELMWLTPKKLFDPGQPIIPPVDMLFGEKDPFVRPPSKSEMQRFFQQSELHFTAGAHWPMRTDADEFHAKLEKIIYG